ncbi:MAG: hypothetical protein IJM61_04940 [Firmicutes bacterium]|nr:hypothetical protein [Bacillota bacterium]
MEASINEQLTEKPVRSKKRVFLIIAICAIVLIGGFFIWFLQPIPLVDKDAEDIAIANWSYNGKGPGAYIMIQPHGSSDTQLAELNEEGTKLLLEKLKTVYTTAYFDSNYVVRPEYAVFDNRISFGVEYNVKDIHYSRFITIYERLTEIGSVFAAAGKPDARKPLRPDSFYDTRLKDKDKVSDLYYFIMDLTEKYAAGKP